MGDVNLLLRQSLRLGGVADGQHKTIHRKRNKQFAEIRVHSKQHILEREKVLTEVQVNPISSQFALEPS